MDPYVKCEFFGRKFQTQVHKSGGKKPVWDETFKIPILQKEESLKSQDFINLVVWDKEKVNDDLVCEGSIKISQLLSEMNQ